MAATIEPEPTEEEREAILAALAGPLRRRTAGRRRPSLEGVEDGELDP